jgi:hypothetical protein
MNNSRDFMTLPESSYMNSISIIQSALGSTITELYLDLLN